MPDREQRPVDPNLEIIPVPKEPEIRPNPALREILERIKQDPDFVPLPPGEEENEDESGEKPPTLH